MPVMTFFRHLVVTPISFLSPSLRKWVLEHWSSFVIDLSFKRTIRPQDPLTLILCPVGLRFHALHHMFPGMPNHNLAAAHDRLMNQLPAEHPYRSSVYPSIWSALGELLSEVRKNGFPSLREFEERVPAQCRDALREVMAG